MESVTLNNGKTEREVNSLLELNAVLTEANEGKGPILDLIVPLSPDESRRISTEIKTKLETDLSSARAFVINEFMADANDETKQIYFSDLVDDLRNLADFLDTAANEGLHITPEFDS